jgi:hypothetical protein
VGTLFLASMVGGVSHAWTLKLDFEQGSPGEPAVGPDAFRALPMDRAPTSLSNARAFSGRQSAEIRVVEGDTLFGGIQPFPKRLGVGDDLTVRFRVYWPPGFDWSADPWLKFFRVHTRSPERTNEGYVDWYINNPEAGPHPPFQVIKELQDQWFQFGRAADAPRHGVWETYSAYYVFDTVPAAKGGSARMRVWKDGRLLADIDDIRTLEKKSSYAYSFQFSYWNGGAPKTQVWYVDEVLLSSSPPDD